MENISIFMTFLSDMQGGQEVKDLVTGLVSLAWDEENKFKLLGMTVVDL